MLYPNFKIAIKDIEKDFKACSYIVHTQKWQGVDISKKPEMATHELLNYSFKVDLSRYAPHSLILWSELEKDIKPNLPWANDHFLERVCGEPLNPGKEWANWPWGNHADKFRNEDGQFNHNYMERYWPKYAGLTTDGTLAPLTDREPNEKYKGFPYKNEGIREPYGDLNDVVDLLAREPDTRQAFMPVFFPEDTGAVHGGRLPCTLGYQFIRRQGYLHIIYFLRSCDIYRHFRDDCYLTARLLFWMLERLKKINPDVWQSIKPGTYTMHITSLHCFKNDMVMLGEQVL